MQKETFEVEYEYEGERLDISVPNLRALATDVPLPTVL